MDYAQQQRRPTKHLVGIGFVILMHILMAWALVSGLARKVVEVIKAPIETKIIEEIKPPPPPPENLPPPPKTLPPPPSFVPPPEVVVQPPPTPAPAITVTQTPPPVTAAPVIAPVVPEAPPAPPPPAPAPVARATAPAIIDAASCAPTSDDYPPAAVRAQAIGTTRVRITVDATGKVSGVDVARSAGPSREHKLLDRVVMAKLGECRFRPGTDANGNPVGGSRDIEYNWTLKD